MGNSLIQLILLAAVAMFLILKLRRTLGTREGFEKTEKPANQSSPVRPNEDELDSANVDRDISQFVDADSEAAKEFARMKQIDREFTVGDFVEGAAAAYEMILLAFADSRLKDIEPFVSEDVYESFVDTISERETEGLVHNARFLGIRQTEIRDVSMSATNEAEITVEFVAELISYVTDADNEIIEGDDKTMRRQRDVWTFSRDMESENPNWRLVETGE